MKKTALVVFGEELPREWRRFGTVIASKKLQPALQAHGAAFIDLGTLVGPGSIYEASALLEELSYLKLADGTRITKSFLYKGYELWWIHYDDLFIHFCLPYTQHKKLLEYLKSFESVDFYRPPFKSLFSCYLQAHGVRTTMLREPGLKSPAFLPFGVFLQMILTLLFLPVLMISRRRLMVYTGDKFEKDKDYDFRMRFVYEELRRKEIPFVEFIRGLQPWGTVLQHAFTRRRPVIYPDAVAFVGRFVSILSGGQSRARREFGAHRFSSEPDSEKRFKLLVATQYLLGVYDDIAAIRIMQSILRVIGVKAAFITAASGRNFHAVLGCKLNAIPTVGIMHGVASRHYNVYEFMPGFDGEKMLSVDEYGIWSEWWKAHFKEYSKAYKPGQVYVSGPMRPLLKRYDESAQTASNGALRVLFVSEEMAVPQEVLPYLNRLLQQKDIELTLKFRPTKDGFEQWLLQHEPDILKRENIRIVKGSMQDAIEHADVAVGCQSTGVLEALLQLKAPLYFRTQKWGDYYSLKEYDKQHSFFAESPEELVEKIRNVRSVPPEALKDLRKRYFGDPYKNGSAWVVDRLQKYLEER